MGNLTERCAVVQPTGQAIAGMRATWAKLEILYWEILGVRIINMDIQDAQDGADIWNIGVLIHQFMHGWIDC